MNTIIYYAVVPLVFLISRLPFFILYRVSDVLFLFIYYVFKYRRRVVFQNLTNSFPEKNISEIKTIEKAYYRFFCDFLVESIKYLTINEKEIRQRCVIDENELLKRLNKEKQSVICVLGHYGNWEWAAPAFSLQAKHQLFVIYKPLSNKRFDALMYRIRSRFGTKLIAMQSVIREMLRNKNTFSSTIFVGDQTPSAENAFWIKFLNQETAVFKGTEVMAKKMNLPVVFVSVRRRKRGHYYVHYEMLCEKPLETADGDISKAHTLMLEREIKQQPEIWLWSHRRWKHKKPTDMELI